MKSCVNFLGLIKRAGKLEIGEKSVEAASKSGRARLILSAADAGANSLKQAMRYADSAMARHIVLPFGKAEIGAVVGRGLPGILAVTDEGFADALGDKLCADFTDIYDISANKPADENPAVKEQGKRRT
ncbi:MAG: 50S ribosomal protein L7ae [Oscillospiraceae bacterium]|nr:50S ribosomal protein L7ae [Oscillospiraceae bacterium]